MFEKGWAIYLKLLAVAPVVGIAYLGPYLADANLSLLAFIGGAPQILLAVALIGSAAVLYSAIAMGVLIYLPSRYGTSARLCWAMTGPQPRAALSALNEVATPDRWFIALFFAPGLVILLCLRYAPWFTDITWLLVLAAVPGAVGAAILWARERWPFFTGFMSSAALFASSWFSVAVGLTLYLTLWSQLELSTNLPFRWASATAPRWTLDEWVLLAVMLAVSAVCSLLFVPSANPRAMWVRMACVSALALATSMVGTAPYYIVSSAFELFASGGEHRIYASLQDKPLEIPPSACADKACRVSKPIRVRADFGGAVYGIFEMELPGAKRDPFVTRRFDTSGTTYQVVGQDAPSLAQWRTL